MQSIEVLVVDAETLKRLTPARLFQDLSDYVCIIHSPNLRYESLIGAVKTLVRIVREIRRRGIFAQSVISIIPDGNNDFFIASETQTIFPAN